MFYRFFTKIIKLNLSFKCYIFVKFCFFKHVALRKEKRYEKQKEEKNSKKALGFTET